MPFEWVKWKDFVNTAQYDIYGSLAKVSGVQGVYDGDAVSEQRITSAVAGAGISFYPDPAYYAGVFVGLSADNPDAGYGSIDFCVRDHFGFPKFHAIYENGIEVWNSGSDYVAGSTFQIKINEAGQIEYFRNEVLLYTSLHAPSFPLFADCSLNFLGVRIWYATIDLGVIAKIDHLPLMGVH